MASDKARGSVFSGNAMGGTPGKNNGMVSKGIGDRQRILSAYPQDNVHGVDLPNTRGGSFRGSPTNLKHSLTGTSAVQDGPGAVGPIKHRLED